MTPKQRFEAAMRHQKPDDFVAFTEVEFHIYEEYVGKKLTIGHELEKLSATEKDMAMHQNARVMIETAERAGHDAIRNLPGYWEISPGRPAFVWLPGEEAQIDQMKILKKLAGDRYFLIGNCSGLTGIPDGLHFERYVSELYENPDDVKRKSDANIAEAIEDQWRVLEAGADGIMNCCDVAFNNGPFISPQMMDEFYFPYFNRWVDSLKAQKIISIWHSDGNLLSIMDRILASGVTAIQCVDPLGGMDIVEVKKQVCDRLALIGNIDCSLLQFGPGSKIEEEVKRVVQGCKGHGGFALSGCNAIYHGIPAEHYQVMVDSRYAYGKEA